MAWFGRLLLFLLSLALLGVEGGRFGGRGGGFGRGGRHRRERARGRAGRDLRRERWYSLKFKSWEFTLRWEHLCIYV